jgi:hypothetical protein
MLHFGDVVSEKLMSGGNAETSCYIPYRFAMAMAPDTTLNRNII